MKISYCVHLCCEKTYVVSITVPVAEDSCASMIRPIDLLYIVISSCSCGSLIDCAVIVQYLLCIYWTLVVHLCV